MFKSKLRETITISGIGPTPPTDLTKILKNSNVSHNGNEWQVRSLSKDSLALFCETIYPIVSNRQTGDLEQVVLEFDDNSGASDNYPQELLVSIKLESGVDFGTEAELILFRQLKQMVSRSNNACFAYAIFSGGVVTIAIPAENPAEIAPLLEREIGSYWSQIYKINIVDRSR